MENNRKNEEIITPQQNNWNLNLQVTPQLWPINNYSVREFVGEKIERDSLSNKNKKQEKPRKTIEKILFANQLSKIILELKIRIFD
jgi:DNA polymerase III delta prime subunit